MTVAAPEPTPNPALMRNRSFLWLWGGQTVSQFGTQFSALALPVLAVSVLGATEFQVGMLNAAETAAFLVVGLPAGAWIDRMIKRKVMIAADVSRAIALAVIPALWFSGVLKIWHLIFVGAFVGVATVFFDVSYQSYLPVLLPGEQITSANSRLETSAQVARISGPGLAGALLAIVSAPVLFVADALSFLLSAAAIWRTRDTERLSDPGDRERLPREIAEGLRFVFGHRILRRITVTTGTSNLFGTLVVTLESILILRILGFSPVTLGLIFGIGSVGGLLGAIATPWISRRIGEGTTVSVSAVAFGVSGFSLPLAGTFPAIALPLLFVGAFLQSFLVLLYNITQVTMRQRLTPPRLLGRMNASIRFVVWGVMPIASIAAGILGTAIGVVPTMWIGATGALLAAVFVLFSPITTMKVLPTELGGEATEVADPVTEARAESPQPEL